MAGSFEASPVDEAAGEGGEGVVKLGAVFPADGEAFELVDEGEGLLDDVSECARSVDVDFAAAGDGRQDSVSSQFAVVGSGIAALVFEERVGPHAGMPARPAIGGTPSTRSRV